MRIDRQRRGAAIVSQPAGGQRERVQGVALPPDGRDRGRETALVEAANLLPGAKWRLDKSFFLHNLAAATASTGLALCWDRQEEKERNVSPRCSFVVTFVVPVGTAGRVGLPVLRGRAGACVANAVFRGDDTAAVNWNFICDKGEMITSCYSISKLAGDVEGYFINPKVHTPKPAWAPEDRGGGVRLVARATVSVGRVPQVGMELLTESVLKQKHWKYGKPG